MQKPNMVQKQSWTELLVIAGILVVPFGIVIVVVQILPGYRHEMHTEAISPNQRFFCRITKKEVPPFGCVEVRLRTMTNQDSPETLLDELLSTMDYWSDVEPGDYRIEWQSDTEFLVGDYPTRQYGWRGRLQGSTWILESTKLASQYK